MVSSPVKKIIIVSSIVLGLFVVGYALHITTRVIDNKKVERQQKKFLNNGILEQITFYSQHEAQGEKKIARNGVYLKRANAKGTVLVCHGFMCDKFDIAFIRTLFPEYNVMTFDFRAHGENVNEEQCCTFGRDEAYDVIAAAQYLKARPDFQGPLFVYGFSMGAVASIQAQALEPTLFDAMVLDCPYDNSENIIKRGLESMQFTLFGYTFNLPGRRLLERYAFHPFVQSMLKTILKTVAHMDATQTNTYIYPLSPAESIKKITAPCFFIHCKNDEKVLCSAAENIYAGAQGYKRLWITQGRRHFDSFFYNPEEYVYRINKFFNSILDASYLKKVCHKERRD